MLECICECARSFTCATVDIVHIKWMGLWLNIHEADQPITSQNREHSKRSVFSFSCAHALLDFIPGVRGICHFLWSLNSHQLFYKVTVCSTGVVNCITFKSVFWIRNTTTFLYGRYGSARLERSDTEADVVSFTKDIYCSTTRYKNQKMTWKQTTGTTWPVGVSRSAKENRK